MLHVCQVCLNNANIRGAFARSTFSRKNEIKKQKINQTKRKKKKIKIKITKTKNKAHEFGVEVGIGDSSDLV